MLLDQLGRGLGPDAADAGHIVHRITHQRQHVADQIRRDAEFLGDLGNVDPRVFHRVEHVDMPSGGRRADQLHQILVRRDDRHMPPLRRRRAGITGDQVVGLEPRHLDTGQRERPRRIANQRELRHQILGRGRAVGLVGIVHIVAERLGPGIENHRQMRRPIGLVQVAGQLPQHRRVSKNRAHRRAHGVGQRRQAVIGAKNIGRSIDEVEVRRAVAGIGHARPHRA